MAKTYTNVGGSSRKVKKTYVNVGGTARKVKKIYANANGIARLCYNAIQFIGAIPSQSNALTYNGNAQSPTWNGYDPNKMTIGGTTSATNAGSYTATFTAKEGWAWSDGSTSKSVTWSIGKAAGSMSLSASSITFDSAGGSKAITVTRSGDGAISATSSNTNIATCSVSGNVVTINNGGTNGTCTITIKVAAGTNYTAPSDKTITVTRYACGETYTWAGYDWIICHVTDTQIFLALSTIHSIGVKFSSSVSLYAGSSLATLAKQFENSLPADALSDAMDTTVNGVTAKIFVASYEQMNGGFSWFNSNARRICNYNGNADWYWTSSLFRNTSDVYSVYPDGRIGSGVHDAIGGFRPFVAIRRK